jgi:hypothetical protein
MSPPYLLLQYVAGRFEGKKMLGKSNRRRAKRTLKCVFKKQDDKGWTWFVWLRVGIEISDSICREFLDYQMRNY